MKHYLATRYQSFTPSAMSEMFAKADLYDDIVNFGIGDPDLPTDPGIIEAAFEDAKNGYTHYGDSWGDPELREEICKFYQEEYGMKVEKNEVFITTSASIAMHIILEGILNPGEEVIVLAPYFTSYKEQIELSHGVCVECECRYEEQFQINPERLETCITPLTKAIIINTPCNPTGNCLNRESMLAICDLAKKYDLLIIADDIYTLFSFQEPFVPIASFEGMKERTIIINSFSKNYMMTGWRLGCIVAPYLFARTFKEINESMVYTAPMVSQRGALYGIRHRNEIQPAIQAEYKSRLEYAAARINAIPKLHVLTPPGGTFYLFMDIRDTGMTSWEFANWLLEKAHVLTIPGNGFGKCGEGFVRLACTLKNEDMAIAFDRMEQLPQLQ